MLKRILSFFTFCLISISALAQSGTLSGTVTDQSSGDALPGVNLYIVELEQGTATNTQGEYTISDIEYGTYTLRASFVGFNTVEQQVTINQSEETLNVQLTSQTQQLDDVVVTAFGLTREERAVSYSVQDVSGEDLTMASENNVIGSLAGKVSGVQVVGSPGAAIGGTEKIRIRGESGLSESNPLFIIDGTPISNKSFNIDDRDYGNLAQDLNLDDIESISVLKGASASALYGNRAADGVIVIETKGGNIGERPVQIDFTNQTSIDRVYKMPDYQNKYAGGYSGELASYTDPETGEKVPGLEYEADESWGPPMNGQMYRPWWSWYHGDFNGDGQDDYGTTVPLEPRPNNVRNFYNTGFRLSNSLAISGGSDKSSYRVSLEDMNQEGVMPNSRLDKTYLNFNGALQHSDKLTSRLTFNYVNTQARGRPTQTYSPVQGNPTQMFNQWFQRQLSMDELRNYRLPDGSIATWNLIDPTAEDLTPQFWDSPYFSVYANVPTDDRNRVYGNYALNYNITSNLKATVKLHSDVYDFTIEDRIASGGLEMDWYRVTKRTRREMNYEGSLQYSQNFQDFSFEGFVGGNLRQERYQMVDEQTEGGLTVPNLYNIEASTLRPIVSNRTEKKDVRSLYGTVNIGWKSMVYADITLRNDWSSALPQDNNSYLYYGFSGSFIFTELDLFANIEWLTFGKLRASMAQVGSDLDPYQVQTSYNLQQPRGTYPAMRVPRTQNNQDLKAAISTDYEGGIDLRFLEGRLRVDGTYYHSTSKNEILNLQLSSATGYDQILVNAGRFTKTGMELQVEGTPIQQDDWNLDVALNWGKLFTNRVDELTDNLNSRLLDRASFGPSIYAREGEEWGKIISNGYLRHANGQPIFNPATGGYKQATNVDQGSILPDWNGGFRLDVTYKNFSLGGLIEFQKGGQFYSVSKMFNNYAGLGAATVGTNVLGNPMRNPVVDKNGDPPVNSEGDEIPAIPLNQAGENSGGMLVEGVDDNGNHVEYLTGVKDFYLSEYQNEVGNIFDASYIKLQSVRLQYTLSSQFVERLPVRDASISIHAQNPLLLYSTLDDIDPSIIQEAGTDFGGWWEGGSVPGTRSVGFTVNLGF